jgi:hypothetical protein
MTAWLDQHHTAGLWVACAALWISLLAVGVPLGAIIWWLFCVGCLITAVFYTVAFVVGNLLAAAQWVRRHAFR